jgi:hypothetical protein
MFSSSRFGGDYYYKISVVGHCWPVQYVRLKRLWMYVLKLLSLNTFWYFFVLSVYKAKPRLYTKFSTKRKLKIYSMKATTSNSSIVRGGGRYGRIFCDTYYELVLYYCILVSGYSNLGHLLF